MEDSMIILMFKHFQEYNIKKLEPLKVLDTKKKLCKVLQNV